MFKILLLFVFSFTIASGANLSQALRNSAYDFVHGEQEEWDAGELNQAVSFSTSGLVQNQFVLYVDINIPGTIEWFCSGHESASGSVYDGSGNLLFNEPSTNYEDTNSRVNRFVSFFVVEPGRYYFSVKYSQQAVDDGVSALTGMYYNPGAELQVINLEHSFIYPYDLFFNETLLVETNVNESPADRTLELSSPTDWLKLSNANSTTPLESISVNWNAGATAKFNIYIDFDGYDIGEYSSKLIDDDLVVNISVYNGVLLEPKAVALENGQPVSGVTFSIIDPAGRAFELVSGEEGVPDPENAVSRDGYYEFTASLGDWQEGPYKAYVVNWTAFFPEFYVPESAIPNPNSGGGSGGTGNAGGGEGDGSGDGESTNDEADDTSDSENVPSVPLALADAQYLGSNFFLSVWFGGFFANADPDNTFLFTQDFGWVWIDPLSSSNGMWWYSFQMDSWLWGSEFTGRIFYRAGDGVWIYVVSNDGGGSYLNNTSTNDWSYLPQL